jgi:hypothetical protein
MRGWRDLQPDNHGQARLRSAAFQPTRSGLLAASSAATISRRAILFSVAASSQARYLAALPFKIPVCVAIEVGRRHVSSLQLLDAMAAYLRSRAVPLGGLKRLATRPPSVTAASLISRRAKASLAQDGQQQVGKIPIGHGRHHVLN